MLSDLFSASGERGCGGGGVGGQRWEFAGAKGKLAAEVTKAEQDYPGCCQMPTHSLSYDTKYLAKRFSGLVMALNSSAFPLGSLKNIVHCSPG